MKDDMDINAGKIVEGTSIEDLGAEIFEEMIAKANGKNKARRKRHNGNNYLLHNSFTVNILWQTCLFRYFFIADIVVLL